MIFSASTLKIFKTIVTATCVAWAFHGATAAADMLPLVVDHTSQDGPVYWWSSAKPRVESPIDRALFGDTAAHIVHPEQQKNFSISRVFQRPQLSVVNAQQIAQMTGATTFFMGQAYADTTEVTWLDSTAATVTIQGDLYDTRSGSQLGNIEIVGRGVSSTPDGAIRLASQAAAHDLQHFQPSRGQRVQREGQLQIIVHAHDKAQTFVTLHEHFQQAVQNRAQIATCRASEGEVALCVHTQEEDADLRAVLLQGLQRDVEHVVIQDIREEDHRIHIYAHTPSDEEQPAERGRPLL